MRMPIERSTLIHGDSQTIGALEERLHDHELADLCVGPLEGGRPLRERLTEPRGGFPGGMGAGARAARPDRRKGLQDRPDLDEDDHRARPEGALARRS